MSSPDDALVARVLNAVPASSYEMGALLSVLRIEATTEVPTACVSCHRRPVLQINPAFVDTWCRTDEHLFLLVMHELHHVLLGHTRQFRRPTPAHNVAFDAVINALLCRRFPQRAYTSFFSSFYANAEGAARLLAPPDGRPWPANDPLDGLHDMLYGSLTVSAAEVFETIVRQQPALLESVLLLGNHDGSETEGLLGNAEAIAAVVASIAGGRPQCSGVHAGSGGDFARTHVDEESADRKVLHAVRRALLSAASGGGGPRRKDCGYVEARTALPNVRDRRAAVARAAGGAPLLFDSLLPERPRTPEGRAAVYLDVSASMGRYLPLLYGALRRLRRHVQPRVHLFSTEVHTVPLGEVCRGLRDTTFGTAIGPVLAHVLAEAPPRALVVTDGMVGQASPALCRQFERRPVDLRVLLTPNGRRQELAAFASRFDELPAL